MRNVKVQRNVAARPAHVWAVLADYPNIAEWNDGVLNSYAVGEPVEVAEGSVVRTEGPRQWIEFDRRTTTAAAIISAVSDVHPIRDVSIEEPEIEELIRQLYTR